MNLRKWITPRMLTIRFKVMLSLALVSIISIASVSLIGLNVSRQIIRDNADQMAYNMVSQLALNLDANVRSFELETFNLMQRYSVIRLLGESDEGDVVIRHQREAGLRDVITQSSPLIRYVRYAFIENDFGDRYYFNQGYIFSDTNHSAEDLIRMTDLFRATLDLITPITWLRIGDELFFARLIVDNRDFEVSGIGVFSVSEDFLVLLEEQDIFSAENLIISHKDNVLFEGSIAAQIVNDERQDAVLTSVTTPRGSWHILSAIDVAILYRDDWLIFVFTMIVGGGVLLLSLLITFFIARSITQNITRMESCMTHVEAGDFSVRIHPKNYDEIGKLGLRLNHMITKMESLIDLAAKERTFKQEAEFKALQAQINPHFLYNTLGSIKWLANRHQDEEIEAMLDSLITLLKGSIRKSNSFLTVTEEIDYVKSYIALQKMRYGDVFEVFYEIDSQVAGEVIPGFLLQPIVENALYHGIDVAERGGIIKIRGLLVKGEERDEVILQVEDNGRGIQEDKIREILHKPQIRQGMNSIGVRSVYERLQAYYGENCSFSIRSEEGEGTAVEIMLVVGGMLDDSDIDSRR